MSVQLILHVGLAIVAIVIIVALVRALPRHRAGWPKPGETAIGFVTNFFDTLGIGSFAPTTSMFKLWRLVPDERIPGTLNVGHTLPTIVEAAIYITIISVVPLTLILLIVAAVAGAWLGAGIVAKLPRQYVQIGMGLALLAAAVLFILSNLRGSYFGLTGDALGLSGTRLLVGVVVSFGLGALMTIGIGMYAPCMILVSLLGMNPKAAFPIMMGSCAFLMPIASLRFIRYEAFSMRAALGLALGGVPGVLIAAYIVKSLPLVAVRWLVVVVVLYAAAAMLRSAAKRTARPNAEDDFAAVP
ncbi:MAG: sulfite exporter TauE/SafE family protein [Candidatus Eremiobacteraeota bacterium]|nr:sulfite exporter TauE/SafE family protein [Candidatus Eremiobacteraeota bacterium]MBV8371835.1 sulfite exporter TauE/SafE family protein [Candidatus Eremiobacteraeota bacterium]